MADRYRITDPESGKTVTVTGDAPPTQDDAEQIFRDAGLRSEVATQSQDQYPALRKAVPGPVVGPQERPNTLMGWGRRAIESLAPTPLFKPAEVVPAYVEGIKGRIEGLTGDVLGIGGAIQELPGMSVPGYKFLPTPSEVTDKLWGPATNPMQQFGRDFPLPFGPSLVAKGAEVAAPYASRMAEFSGVPNAYRATRDILATRNLPPEERAQAILERSLARDRVTPEQANITTARYPDKQIAVMDVGGPATARLARRVKVMGGEGETEIQNFLEKRQDAQHARLIDDIRSNLGGGTNAYDTGKALEAARDAASMPLRKQAFEGGSVAPLQTQFENALNDVSKQSLAAQREVSDAQAALEQAQHRTTLTDNVYAQSSARQDIAAARERLNQAQTVSNALEAQHADILDRLRAAQGDAATNRPGAVWSPRVQQFIETPEVQSGIKHGLKIQRLEALGKGEPFNPTEYGITGYGANGDPIVAKVPNMRLLDAGKIGLDAQIEAERKADGRLTELGGALNVARKAYVAELDRINPTYAKARAAYSGPTQSRNAIYQGTQFTKFRPEEIRDYLAKLSEGDKEFYRLGVRQELKDRVLNAGDNADAVKTFFSKQAIRDRIEAAFGRGAADTFEESMKAEKLATRSNRFVMGGSNTTDKAIDLSAEGKAAEIAADVVRGAVHGGITGMTVGGPIGAIKGAAIGGVVQPLARTVAGEAASRYIGRLQGISPEVNAQLARLLTRTGDRPVNVLPRGNLPPLAVDNRAARASVLPPVIAATTASRLIREQPSDNRSRKSR